WAAGVIPAIVDGMLRVNLVRHNTQWVPGHFHFYLLLGLVPLLLGTLLYACTRSDWTESALDRASFWIYGIAGAVFCFVFLAAGWQSVPRRFAVHDSAWLGFAQIGSLAATLAVLAALVLGVRLLARLARVSRPAWACGAPRLRRRGPASPALPSRIRRPTGSRRSRWNPRAGCTRCALPQRFRISHWILPMAGARSSPSSKEKCCSSTSSTRTARRTARPSARSTRSCSSGSRPRSPRATCGCCRSRSIRSVTTRLSCARIARAMARPLPDGSSACPREKN